MHIHKMRLTMLRLFISTLGFASLFLSFTPTQAQAATSTISSSSPKTVCAGTQISQEWVVINDAPNPVLCGWNFPFPNHAELLALPLSPAMRVCVHSPIPLGWVVVKNEIDLTRCGLNGEEVNVKTIMRPTGAIMQICAESPVPPEWVITGEYRYVDRISAWNKCDNLLSLGMQGLLSGITLPKKLLQMTIEPVSGTSMHICNDSPLPQGYQIVRLVTDTNCRINPRESLLITPVK